MTYSRLLTRASSTIAATLVGSCGAKSAAAIVVGEMLSPTYFRATRHGEYAAFAGSMHPDCPMPNLLRHGVRLRTPGQGHLSWCLATASNSCRRTAGEALAPEVADGRNISDRRSRLRAATTICTGRRSRPRLPYRACAPGSRYIRRWSSDDRRRRTHRRSKPDG